MKRTGAAAKENELSRQRALIRSLIERNGWSSPAPTWPDVTKVAPSSLPDNVIPFPLPPRAGRRCS